MPSPPSPRAAGTIFSSPGFSALDVAGAYVLAYNLADVPAVQVGEQVTDVLMAALAHMDVGERKRALVRTVGLLALVMFPLAAGLGSVASSVAHTFLTRAWAGVAPMLMSLLGPG